MKSIKYRLAETEDEAAIKALLKKCDLPYEDIHPFLNNYIVARMDEKIVGVDGIEIYGRFGLLRSLAVEPEYRRQGIAAELNARLQSRAQQVGVKEFYLLTQTAVQYSVRLGFREIARDKVPQTIQNTVEFKSLCPKTAVCMLKKV